LASTGPEPKLSAEIPSLGKSVGAGVMAQVWSAAIQLLCIPIFVRLLGVESYGLIGFYITLQAALQILDFGLSPTVNRELARYSAVGDLREARDFVKTLQTLYLAIAVLIGATVWFAAGFIANGWIHASTIPASSIQSAVRLMALLAALQWPLSFYGGGLIGLHRQPLLNGIKALIATAANLGAVAVLMFIEPTILAFLEWQLVISAIHVTLLGRALWRILAHPSRPKVQVQLLRRIWRFVAGMTGIGASGILLTQLDKLILVKILPLHEFGYYALATTAAGGLYMIVTAMFNGLFPRFSLLVARGDEAALRRIYHLGTQFMAFGLLPAAAVMALQGRAVAFAWTGDPVLASHVATVLTILAAATAMHGLMHMPFALQLSHGWTRIGLTINVFLLLIQIPAILTLVPRYGALAAAGVWLAVTTVYMVVGVPLTHRKLLHGVGKQWLSRDVILPAIGAVAGAALLTPFVQGSPSRLAAVCIVGASLVLASIGDLIFSTELRRNVVQRLRLLRTAWHSPSIASPNDS
jgi:O-antigen/teichoic acid export membrane protein